MSETVKPTIAALRAWLKTCPLIADEQEATGAAFRIAGLEEESTAFSIEDSPGDPIITEYISGWEMAKNYLFLSRREYSEMDSVNIQNSGFFEQLTEWVMRQDTIPFLMYISSVWMRPSLMPSTAAAPPCSLPPTMCTSGGAWPEKGGFEP